MIVRIALTHPAEGLSGTASRTGQTLLRALLPLTSLAVTYFAFATSPYAHVPDSTLCLNGGCRFDQMYDAVRRAGASEASVKALVVEDPGNPDEWCSFGELLRGKGNLSEAKAAFDRAVALGPGMASVRMRAANFYFTNNYPAEGRKQSAALLSSHTSEFDEALFSYLTASLASEGRPEGKALSELLGTAIPAEPRPARAWLNWLLSQRLEENAAAQGLAMETWHWMLSPPMLSRHLMDEATATRMVNTFWQRKEYAAAEKLWLEWRGEGEAPAGGQLLFNTTFKNEPRPVPFDWELAKVESVDYIRQDGVRVRFMGQANVNLASPRQAVALTPGRYRFSARVSAEGLTTNEGPFFQIMDAENGARLEVHSQPMLGSLNLSSINLDFAVGPATHAVVIQLARTPSQKFDNKIEGSLHIYSTSLERLGLN